MLSGSEDPDLQLLSRAARRPQRIFAQNSPTI